MAWPLHYHEATDGKTLCGKEITWRSKFATPGYREVTCAGCIAALRISALAEGEALR